jgi:phage shock protein E
MDFLKKLFGFSSAGNEAIKQALENGAVIIDVRTPSEFSGGHPKGARNIPLQQLPHKVNEIKKLKKPVVLCCASGMRSASARALLSKEGIECLDAGSWRNLN